MTPPRHTDAAIIAGIAEATAAWQAEQDTVYYAERFGYTPGAMLAILKRLETEGRIERREHRVWGGIVSKWRVTP